MEVSVEEMESLISKLEEANKQLAIAQAERNDLYEVGIGIMDFMGVLDPKTRRMYPEIASKEESPFPYILKALGNVTGIMMRAKAPAWAGGKEAEKELEQKFYYVKKLIEIVQKYGADPNAIEGGNEQALRIAGE